MIQIPADFHKAYTSFIEQKGVNAGLHRYYIKWLRYYLDFCHKYNLKQAAQESLADFTGKLKEKKQPENLIKQAHHAIALFSAMEYFPGRKPRNGALDIGGTATICPPFNTSSLHTKGNLIGQAVSPDYIHADTATPSRAGKISPDISMEFKQSGADWTEVFNELMAS